MSQARISVAIAVYNGERFVREQLESFARQTRLPDELVVSDDASTDGSVEIVREFATHAPFTVKLLANRKNVGCTRNFERAIDACTGDIIFLSDWDDVQYPDKIAIMERALRECPSAAIALCNADLVDEQLRPLGQTFWEVHRFAPSRRIRNAMSQGRIFRSSLVAGGACMAFRGELKQLILPIPVGAPPIYHDSFIVWTILLSGAGGVALVEKPLFAYRQHDRQASSAGGNTRSRFGRLAERLKRRAKRPPFAPLIERLESPLALAHSRNPELRESALRHLRARWDLPRARIKRIPSAIRELLTLRYHRFSHGFGAAAKDFFFVE